jgi:hypothetical protein
MTTVDFHVHAFPDSSSGRAVSRIRGLTGIQAVLDGRVSSLIDSMNSAGIGTSVLLSIATKPSQFGSILEWSKEISSDRIVHFPSVHPADPGAAAKVRKRTADPPRGGQANALGLLNGLGLEKGLMRAILHENARKPLEA